MRSSAVLVALSAALVAAGPVSDAAAQAAGGYVAPRTEWGHPDLQGNWSNATVTPLQRRQGWDRVLTPQQVAQLEGHVQSLLADATQPSDPNRPAPPVGGDNFDLPPEFIGAAGGTGGYDYVFIDSGDRVAWVDGEPRSSLVTIPENGRIPSLTPEAQQLMAARGASRRGFEAYDHPEIRPLADRCIVSFGRNAGPPILPNGFYNNNYTIAQNADHVMIMTEMIHDVRVIRLGDGPRLPPEVRPWFGESWGRWEGETLVVETTNFHPEYGINGLPSDNLKVIERFTRVNDATILYEFLVDDPTVWVEPWGGQIPMNRMNELVFEYACHEGNYALYNILSGARYQERLEAERERAQAEPR